MIGAPARELALTPEALTSSVPAPRIAEIVADEASMAAREHDPYFAWRAPYIDWREPMSRDWIIATTEARALRDYTAKLSGMAAALCLISPSGLSQRANRAEQLRDDVHFIGRQELETATTAIARHWLDKLNASQAGELFVAMPETDSSNAFMFLSVMEALTQLDPDAASRVALVSTPHESVLLGGSVPRIREAGIVLLDDWTISGSQLLNWISWLVGVGVPKDAIEVNLVAATPEAVGGSLGVPCKSYFVYPHDYEEQPSITGAHCDTDYGFKNELHDLYDDARRILGWRRGDTEEVGAHRPGALPLLYRVGKSYRIHNSLPVVGSPEAEVVFQERKQRCKAVASQIVGLRSLFGQEVGV